LIEKNRLFQEGRQHQVVNIYFIDFNWFFTFFFLFYSKLRHMIPIQKFIREFGCESGGLWTSVMEVCCNDMNFSKSPMSLLVAALRSRSQQWCWPFTVTCSVQSHIRRGATPETVTTLSERVSLVRLVRDDGDPTGLRYTVEILFRWVSFFDGESVL